MNSDGRPVFSIVMPTYNRAWVLERTISCVRNQDFLDWELIVVDDGSVDETKVLVERLAREGDRIRYIYKENGGQSSARNIGKEFARGEWVTYVDSDEELYPFYLSEALAFFKTHPNVTFAMALMDVSNELIDANHKVITSYVRDPKKGATFETLTLNMLANWEIYPCGTGIFHRFELTGDLLWDTSMVRFEDIDSILQLGLKYPDGFGFIPRPLFHQHQAYGCEGVCSNTSYGEWADGFEQLYKKYEGTWLMEGQTWYPEKVKRYRERQRRFDLGQYPSPHKFLFPDYYHVTIPVL